MAISGIATSIISKLGDNAGSIVPVIAKDTGNSVGVTLLHRKHGSEQDGKEKAIEEFGTEAIWLGGIPLLKKVFDLTAYKIAGIDPRFDVRKFNPKNADNIKAMMDHTKDAAQLKALSRIDANRGLTKALFASKFVAATAATLVALTALIKYKQKTTEEYTRAKVEKQIAQEKRCEEYISKSLGESSAFQMFRGLKQQPDNTQSPAFKGAGAALGEFMFNPVKNMSLLDVGIFTTRVKHGRKGEKFEIGLKEVMNFAFIYLLATPIQKGLEAFSAKAFNRPIDLDYRILSNENFKNQMKNNGNGLKDAASEFVALNDKSKIGQIFEQGQNGLVKLFKETGEIATLKNGEVSVMQFFSPSKVKNIFGKEKSAGLHKVAENMIKFIEASSEAAKKGVDTDDFIKQARKLKAGSIFANIGITILFVGILQPTIAILSRKVRSKGETADNLAFKEVETKIRNSLS